MPVQAACKEILNRTSRMCAVPVNRLSLPAWLAGEKGPAGVYETASRARLSKKRNWERSHNWTKKIHPISRIEPP